MLHAGTDQYQSHNLYTGRCPAKWLLYQACVHSSVRGQRIYNIIGVEGCSAVYQVNWIILHHVIVNDSRQRGPDAKFILTIVIKCIQSVQIGTLARSTAPHTNIFFLENAFPFHSHILLIVLKSSYLHILTKV